jgi:hypothetical protein
MRTVCSPTHPLSTDSAARHKTVTIPPPQKKIYIYIHQHNHEMIVSKQNKKPTQHPTINAKKSSNVLCLFAPPPKKSSKPSTSTPSVSQLVINKHPGAKSILNVKNPKRVAHLSNHLMEDDPKKSLPANCFLWLLDKKKKKTLKSKEDPY